MIFTMLLGFDMVHARHHHHYRSHMKGTSPNRSRAAHPRIEIKLEGFKNRRDLQQLKKEFQQFINTIPVAKFPIKIDRRKHMMGKNEYYWGSTEIASGLLSGPSTKNRSRTIGRTFINPNKFGELLDLLDKERVVSKIVIQRDENTYTIEKSGILHSAYRGAMLATKVAAVAAIV